MNLKEHYNQLYTNSIQKIKAGAYQTDSLIDSPSDKRLGITLLIRPPQPVKNQIQQFLTSMKAIESGQYYYPDSDIHITVMSIISCYDGFDPVSILVEDYVEKIQESIQGFKKFEIEFTGITASPSCVMIQGFPDQTLNSIRDQLRTNFKNSELEQSLDQRYQIQTAHSTVVRLRTALNNKDKFIEKLNAHKNIPFGTFKVDSMELVVNDWYQRKQNTKKLFEFELE